MGIGQRALAWEINVSADLPTQSAPVRAEIDFRAASGADEGHDAVEHAAEPGGRRVSSAVSMNRAMRRPRVTRTRSAPKEIMLGNEWFEHEKYSASTVSEFIELIVARRGTTIAATRKPRGISNPSLIA